MCYTTATEFKNKLGHYMELSKTEDVIVIKNKGTATILINEDDYRLLLIERAKGMFEKTKKEVNYDEIINEEIMKRCEY